MAKKMANINEVTVLFAFEKSTAGTHRYQEIDAEGNPVKTSDSSCNIGSLYLRKSGDIGSKAPERLKVTIAVE